MITPFAKGKFLKTEVVKQSIPAKSTVLYDIGFGDTITSEVKNYKAKTLIHNQIQL